MNGNSSFFSLTGCQELVDDVVWRSGPIEEIEVQMLDPRLCELLFVILWFIKPNDQSNPHFLENWHVIIWSKTSIFISLIERA
jgi:hypothetical protein